MRKKLNFNFCENIISSDFFFYKNYKKNSLLFNLNLTKQKKYAFIDILSLHKEIKQLIRLISFLFKNNEKSLLVIIVENSFQQILIKKFFLKYKINFPINVRRLDEHYLMRSNSLITTMILSLINIKEGIIKDYVYNKGISLINVIDTIILNKKNFNVYTIFNKLDTNKKIFFLLVVLKLLKKKND
jgi:hypothetical protein